METRKYGSPQEEDKSNRKVPWKSKKARMALVLAVSLWIGGGGIVSAGQTTIIADGRDGDVYGNHVSDNVGEIDNNADLGNNTVIITGGDVKKEGSNVSVFGAYVETAAVSGKPVTLAGNQVIVSGGKIINGNELAGAAAYNNAAATLTNNTVTVKGSAYINADIDGGMTEGKADSNHVFIEGGTVFNVHIYGGRSFKNGDARNNTVTISGGDITASGMVVGGSIDNTDAGVNAIGNTVTISGGNIKVSEIIGGYVGSSNDGVKATNNTVTISGGNIEVSKIVGGYLGEKECGGNATGNNVTVSSVVTGNIYGGFSKRSGGTSYTTKNMVTLKGATVNGDVCGGKEYHTITGDFVTGNTLNLSGRNTINNQDQSSQGKIQNFETVNITEAKWGTPVLTMNGTGIVQNTGGTWAAIDASKLKFENFENIANGETMDLFVGSVGNVTFAANTTALQEYTVTPVTGVLVNAAFQGQLSIPDDKKALVCTAENKATKLTFGNVEWKDSGALINHATTLSTISFNGADVDTTNIKFKNIQELKANKKMTLVSDFGNSVGTITGTKYKVGNALEGEGSASLVDGDNDGTKDALIFTANTGVGNGNGGDNEPVLTAIEKTHNAVMGAEVGMAALSAGNDFVGAATEGLSMAGNTGTDGLATYANMGGGSMKVETGSHVKTRTWNAILALGHKNEKKLSATEYGAFFEYGRGNYTTFNGDERGDGSTHYTGGGILGKWKKNNGFYVEGSLRAGSIHDDATNVLRADDGTPYSYTTDSTYWGAHIGVGKEIKLNKTDVLDLYAKYFYNHRGSVSFDAGGDHYDLDAVESSVLRVGTRYTVKQNDNFKYYGGLAVEHEFAGRAAGTVEGVTIRGADISGTSVRGEIGATFRPGEKSNVTLDLNLSGFAGKKQGLTGGLSAVFHI